MTEMDWDLAVSNAFICPIDKLLYANPASVWFPFVNNKHISLELVAVWDEVLKQ